MPKYFVVYRVPVATMEEWRKNTPHEEMKAQGEKLMADIMEWRKKHGGDFIEKGSPLGKTKSVTASGIMDTKNDLNYYEIVEAESHETAAKMFSDSPHLQIPTSSIEVMEIPKMGM